MENAIAVNRSNEKGRGRLVKVLLGLGLGVGSVGVAMAASGGPFGAISNFIQTNFMPFIGSVGVAGGIGYGAVHAFKHDYGKAAVGVGTAAGGGFLIAQYGWFGQQAGISAATLGQHISTLAMVAHGLGL